METEIKRKRCAVYTRKSLEDAVEKEFNSIDAQREAGEAYVRSQKANGWELLPKRYDDYGFSGGNVNRPALQELLKDCEAGLVDVVIIYKLDRLSRSICDFADLTAKFDRWSVSFVAVTQEINTATSAGRMMLNILITFAQYEREVIAERIRDKKAATRRKGKWDGGVIPFGYLVADHRLVAREDEAKTVRLIYERYLAIQSPKQIVLELNAEAATRYRNGKPWTMNQMRRILRNPLYIGKVEYKGETYEGEHDGLVDEETWKTVQQYMDGNIPQPARERGMDGFAPLRGILRCGHCGCAMTPAFSYKGDKKYCFYVCVKDAKRAERECPIRRISAGEVENYVFAQLGKLVRMPEIATAIADTAGVAPRQALDALGDSFTEGMTQGEKQRLAELLIETVTINENEVAIELKTAGIEKIAKEAYEIED